MKLLDELKERIVKMGSSTSAGRLARIGASMCHDSYSSVPFLDISVGFDQANRELVKRCLFITDEPDYSNADQFEFLHWLEQRGWDIERWSNK